jgi:hypothetical protein
VGLLRVSALNPFSNYCSISLLHGEACKRTVITDGAWSSFIRVMAGCPDSLSSLPLLRMRGGLQ